MATELQIQHTSQELEKAIDLLFNGEASRDAIFQEKEATRDAANRAALNAAESISHLEEVTDNLDEDVNTALNAVNFVSRGYYTGSLDDLIGFAKNGVYSTNKAGIVLVVGMSASTMQYFFGYPDTPGSVAGTFVPKIHARRYYSGSWSEWSTVSVPDLVSAIAKVQDLERRVTILESKVK